LVIATADLKLGRSRSRCQAPKQRQNISFPPVLSKPRWKTAG